MALPVTIRPPFGVPANAAMVRSISPASRMLTGLTSSPTDDATNWLIANWPIPDEKVASRRTAARVTRGAISLSSSISSIFIAPQQQHRWQPTQGRVPRFIGLDPVGHFLYAANEL